MSTRSVFITRLFLLLLVLVFTGCGDQREEGLQLARSGEATAQSLEKFYTKLYQYKADEIELEAFDLGTRDTAMGMGNLTRRVEILRAINSRIELAQTMKASYASLKDLSEYNARAEVKEAAGNLLDSFDGLIPFPGAKAPKTLFGGLLGELAAAQQSGDIRDGAVAIRSALEVTLKIYSAEHPDVDASMVSFAEDANFSKDSFDIKSNSLYDTIIEERYKNLWDAITKLAKSGALENATFNPEATRPLLIEIGSPTTPDGKERVINGFKAVSGVRLFRAYRADLDEADLQKAKLTNLLKRHDELFKRSGKGKS